MPASPSRVLEALGVGELDEQVYVALLERPRASLDEVCEQLGLPARRVGAALRRLETSGLVSVAPERPVRYLPAPPDVAVEALVMRKQEELHQARLAVPRLVELMRDSGGRGAGRDDLVEVVVGREAVVQRFDQIFGAAEREVVVFDRPPYARPDAANPLEDKVLSRGVVVRCVYDAKSVELPGAVDRLRDYIAAGEQARVFSPLPMKLVVVDGRIGLLPLDLHGAMVHEAMLIRPSGLLDALLMFFETVWARAVEIGTAALPASPAGDSDDERLLTLLAAGLKDEAVARQLGVSARTLDRRVQALMQELQARTRFQAGWAAALRAQSSR